MIFDDDSYDDDQVEWDEEDQALFEVDFETAGNMFSGMSYEEARDQAIRDRRENRECSDARE
jgi:hypothetical protein